MAFIGPRRQAELSIDQPVLSQIFSVIMGIIEAADDKATTSDEGAAQKIANLIGHPVILH